MKNLSLNKALVLVLIAFSGRLLAQTASQQYYREGEAAANRGKTAEAHESFSKSAISADRGGAVAYHNMGLNYERRGDMKNALKSYEEAVRRNPSQIESIERCVILHHRNANWRQTIYFGELGVKAAPLNTAIPPLLLDAYDKQRAGKSLYAYDKEHTLPDTNESKKYRFDFGIGAAAGIGYSGSFSFLHDTLTFVPFYLQCDYRHSDKMSFYLRVDNPDNGALLEDTVFLSERIGFAYHLKKSAIGAGFLLNHYYGDNFTDKKEMLHDLKLGLTYTRKDEKNELSLVWFPRLLPSDLGKVSGRSFDANLLSIDYALAYNSYFDFVAGFGWREYVFFDHRYAISSYEGLCDITAGLRFFNNGRSNHTLTTTLTDRIYLRDRGNTHPYDSFNGQGFLGTNANLWFKGDPLSGYRTNSYILGIRMDHFVLSNFGIHETIRIEAVMPSQKTNSISIEIGGSGKF